jgi:hypothetical protein
MVAEIRAMSADWSLRPPVLRRPDLNRTDEVTVDFNSDGALQEINTHYEAVLIFLAQHCAGQAGKAAGFDTDSLARVDVRAGSIGKTGSQHSLQTRNFFIGYGGWTAIETDNVTDARRREHMHKILDGEAAKNVPGEERQVQGLNAIGP